MSKKSQTYIISLDTLSQLVAIGYSWNTAHKTLQHWPLTYSRGHHQGQSLHLPSGLAVLTHLSFQVTSVSSHLMTTAMLWTYLHGHWSYITYLVPCPCYIVEKLAYFQPQIFFSWCLQTGMLLPDSRRLGIFLVLQKYEYKVIWKITHFHVLFWDCGK